MYKILAFLCFFTFLTAEETPPLILVSVAPYKFLVEEIGGANLKVMTMVPAGASAHTYEPPPKEMIEASKAVIWFRLGESFEGKAIAAIKSVNPNFMVYDLRKGLNLLHGQCSHAHCSQDLHLWLSLRMVKIQVQEILEELVRLYPQHREAFTDRAKTLQKSLDELKTFGEEKLAAFKGATLMVSHPAYAYFAQEYGLKQLSIEFEGREPTAKQLTTLLTQAKNAKVKTIFIQPQYSAKAAMLVADNIGARIVQVDPYAEDFLDNYKNLTVKIAEGLSKP